MGRDVDIKIRDGGLGVVPSGDGALGVVGCGPEEIPGVILITRENYQKRLGLSPLRDFAQQVFSLVDIPIYCRSLAPSVAGSVEPVSARAENEGVGSLSVSGNPVNRFEISVVIESSGGLNTASFRYVIDGWKSDVITIPAEGSYVIPGTGLTLAFAAGSPTGSQKSFVFGDTYSFSTGVPTATNQELLAALDDLIDDGRAMRHLCVAAITQAAFWSAFAVKLEMAEARHKYLSGSTMARYIGKGETLDAYIKALLKEERGSVTSIRLMVCPMWIKENDVAGYVDVRNGLGKILGRMFAVNMALSPGATRLGALPGVEEIMPRDGEKSFPDAHIQALEEAGYATLRYYDGKKGVYVNDSTLMSPEGSDFTNCCRIDVLNKARRLIRLAQFPYIKDNFDVLDDGTVPQLEQVSGAGKIVLSQMAKDKEISSGRIEMPIDQNILSKPVITEKIFVTPVGSFKEISGEIQYENPALGGDK